MKCLSEIQKFLHTRRGQATASGSDSAVVRTCNVACEIHDLYV